MSNEKPNNTIMEILARKKAMQANKKGNFNPNEGTKGKASKGFGGPAVTRKTGRGS